LEFRFHGGSDAKEQQVWQLKYRVYSVGDELTITKGDEPEENISLEDKEKSDILRLLAFQKTNIASDKPFGGSSNWLNAKNFYFYYSKEAKTFYPALLLEDPSYAAADSIKILYLDQKKNEIIKKMVLVKEELYSSNLEMLDFLKNNLCRNNYTFVQFIGKGGYGNVVTVRSNKGKEYVAKIVTIDAPLDQIAVIQNLLSHKHDDHSTKPISLEEYEKEVKLIKFFNENDIGPKMKENWTCEYNGKSIDYDYRSRKIEKEYSKTYGVIIMEKWDRALKIGDVLEEGIFNKLKFQVNKIHELGYIHMDLLPRNILVKTSAGDDNKIIGITVSDFGITKKEEAIDGVSFNLLYRNQAATYLDKESDDLQKNKKLLDLAIIAAIEKNKSTNSSGKTIYKVP
jgi:hypothetical protein